MERFFVKIWRGFLTTLVLLWTVFIFFVAQWYTALVIFNRIFGYGIDNNFLALCVAGLAAWTIIGKPLKNFGKGWPGIE